MLDKYQLVMDNMFDRVHNKVKIKTPIDEVVQEIGNDFPVHVVFPEASVKDRVTFIEQLYKQAWFYQHKDYHIKK